MRRISLTKYLFRTLMDSVDNPTRTLNGHQRRRVAKWWDVLDPHMSGYLSEIDKAEEERAKANTEAEFEPAKMAEHQNVLGWKIQALDKELGGWFEGEPVSIVLADEDFGSISALWKPDAERDDMKVGGRHWRRVIAAIDKAFAEAKYVTEKELKEAETSPDGKPDNVTELVKAGKRKGD